MKLPEIGDIITTQKAVELAAYFDLNYLVDRITTNQNSYRAWSFDGCSGLPDEVIGLFAGCDWKDITYKCCLPHDLCYAYGEIGNETEREQVDKNFYDDLATKAGMRKWLASVFLSAVRIGGAEELGLSFSWGFEHK